MIGPIGNSGFCFPLSVLGKQNSLSPLGSGINCLSLTELVKGRWLDIGLIQYYDIQLHHRLQKCIEKNLVNIQLFWVNKSSNDVYIITWQKHIIKHYNIIIQEQYT